MINVLNQPILITNLLMNKNGTVTVTSFSSIRVLPGIPSHLIQSTLPTFLDFPWFSLSFYLWIHMEIENIYRFAVTKRDTLYEIECNFIGKCNTQLFIV